MIQTIKLLYPDCSRISNKDLYELSKDNQILKILSKSHYLQFVDLRKLLFGDHTLSFFLNLWNLLFLHTLLTIWARDLPINPLKRCISNSSHNYLIGSLGRISLTTLRYKLLGSMTWDLDVFSKTEDINEVVWQDLELVTDPRVVFAMANEFYESPAIRVCPIILCTQNLIFLVI